MADCTLCGCRWINGYMGCSRPNCNEYRLMTECNEWPVLLGLSIRRFARRAEVEGLVRAADRATADLIDNHDDFDAVDRAIKQHDTALSRLAALAMEVEP